MVKGLYLTLILPVLGEGLLLRHQDAEGQDSSQSEICFKMIERSKYGNFFEIRKL